jgi:glycosyltransferase involved in cell wall biosynthesis
MNDMHVIHAIDSLYGGGAESSLLEIVPALAARGVRTSIVTLLDDDGSLDERVRGLGISRTRVRQRSLHGQILALRDIVRQQQPDLLHTTFPYGTLIGRPAALMARTPVVTTLANSNYGPEERAAYGSWRVSAFHAADLATGRLTRRFHAVSAEVARAMSRRLRIPGDRMQVVYRGRDPVRLGSPTQARRLRVRADLGLRPDAPVVLSVGRVEQQKAVETTVAAFRTVRDRMPDAVLLIAGRPGDASSAVDAAASGMSGVILLGHRSDVADLMCAADVLAFPSRWEGLPGTLIEAMALRLPIVGSDIAPIAEAMGSVGWPMVRRDDPPALAAELIAILGGSASVEARKEAGQRRFWSTFTIDAAADGMLSFYNQALGRAGAAAPGSPSGALRGMSSDVL